MLHLETGEVTELEYQTVPMAVVHVCQICRKIFDSDLATTEHLLKLHGITDESGADVRL